MMNELESLRAEAAALPVKIQEAAKSRNLETMRALKNRHDDMPIILGDAAIRELESHLAELDKREPALIADAKRARAASDAARAALNEAWKAASAAETADNAAWSQCYSLQCERETLKRRIAQIQGIIDSHHAVEPIQTARFDLLTDLHWMREYVMQPLTH